jgi:hypothetical protein
MMSAVPDRSRRTAPDRVNWRLPAWLIGVAVLAGGVPALIPLLASDGRGVIFGSICWIALDLVFGLCVYFAPWPALRVGVAVAVVLVLTVPLVLLVPDSFVWIAPGWLAWAAVSVCSFSREEP